MCTTAKVMKWLWLRGKSETFPMTIQFLLIQTHRAPIIFSLRATNTRDLRWTYEEAVMYHVTMETADICSKHRPEEQVTLTTAHTHTYTYTSWGQAGEETVRRNQSQHWLLSLGFQAPRFLSEGLRAWGDTVNVANLFTRVFPSVFVFIVY